MRSLSSTVSDSPSSWLPSRSVVSKISTERTSADMFDPVLVAVYLSADRRKVRLLDSLGDRARLAFADDAVVDIADGNHLGSRPGQKRLIRGVQVAAQDVGRLDLEVEVARDGHHRVLGDPLERAGRHWRGEELAVLDDEDVLARAFADVALGREQDGLVVACLQRFDLGHRRVDVHTRSLRGRRHRVGVMTLPGADLAAHTVGHALVAEIRAPRPDGDG